MNRSGWITGVVVAQALWALTLIDITVLLIVLARMATAAVSSGLRISGHTGYSRPSCKRFVL